MDDARALNAPLIAQRETAKLKLAGLPARRVLPGVDEIDPGRFREAVLLAWRQRPLDERRDALDRLIEEITLSEGGAQVAYRVKDPRLGFRYQEPYGPPYGSWGQYRVSVEAEGVRRPRRRGMTTAKFSHERR